MSRKNFLMLDKNLYHNVLKIKPPLIFNKNNADYFLEAFEYVLSDNKFKVQE